jgi:putative ubiquitin-RnfH superfamily antitoxin RatB of RatAB toxin-antitoxin module
MFINKMKQEHFETYENYTNLPNQILIEVELTECRIWGIYNSLSNCESKIEESSREEIIKVLDLKKKTLRNITCDKLKDGF